jgi:hypothetical protein
VATAEIVPIAAGDTAPRAQDRNFFSEVLPGHQPDPLPRNWDYLLPNHSLQERGSRAAIIFINFNDSDQPTPEGFELSGTVLPGKFAG